MGENSCNLTFKSHHTMQTRTDESVGTISTPRRVYGKDLLIRSRDNRDVTIYVIERADGKFSPSRLKCRFGSEHFLFIKNKNLHDLPPSLRGTLMCINDMIGLILKIRGTHCIFEVLLPSKKKGQLFVFDLSRKDSGLIAFYLQQIQGPLLGVPSLHVKTARKQYPYLDRLGHISMDPAGPHVFETRPMKDIPEAVLDELNSHTECLSRIRGVASSKHHRRDQKRKKMCPYHHVLYMVDHSGRVSFLEKANVFYIPLGMPFGSTNGPSGKWYVNLAFSTHMQSTSFLTCDFLFSNVSACFSINLL